MSVALRIAREELPDHASKFSRHDFTLVQLLACLALREMLKLSYRKLEAMLIDTDWCQRLGMKSAPRHSTLCRAFNHIVGFRQMNAKIERIIVRMCAGAAPGALSAGAAMWSR